VYASSTRPAPPHCQWSPSQRAQDPGSWGRRGARRISIIDRSRVHGAELLSPTRCESHEGNESISHPAHYSLVVAGRPPSFHVPRWDAIRAICRHLAARHRHLRAHPARRRSRRACSSGTAPSGRRGSRPDSRASISLRATAPVPSPACSTRPRSCGWGPRRPRAEEERCLEVWRYEVARRCQSVAAEPLGRELET
jgi:hypothetical protein